MSLFAHSKVKTFHRPALYIGGIGLLHKYIPTTLLSTDFQTGSSFLKKPFLSAPAVLFAPQSLDAKRNNFAVAEVYAVYSCNNITTTLKFKFPTFFILAFSPKLTIE